MLPPHWHVMCGECARTVGDRDTVNTFLTQHKPLRAASPGSLSLLLLTTFLSVSKELPSLPDSCAQRLQWKLKEDETPKLSFLRHLLQVLQRKEDEGIQGNIETAHTRQ